MKEYIEAELARLEEGGELTPKRLVELASDPAHPLHEEFEWDDTAAAQQYRLHQARAIIRSVVIETKTTTVNLRTVAYVHDPSLPPKEAGYVSIRRIKSDDERAAQAMRAEIDRVRNSSFRAREVAVGLGLEAEVEAALMAAVRGNGTRPDETTPVPAALVQATP